MTKDSAPLVSFVVLSYNHKKYVQQAIESICRQSYENIEIIVVDDGSTDGSVELLSKLRDFYPFQLILQSNSGIVAALNRGVEAASGDFVVPHASDDVSELNRVREQLKSFENNAEIGFVVGGIEKISEFGDVLEKWIESPSRLFDFNDFIEGRARAIAVSCMYRGDVIRSVMPLDPNIPFEDVQLYWACSNLGFKCFFDGAVCATKYRILENSLGRKDKTRLHYGFLRMIEKYRDHPKYRVALARAKTNIFCELAEANRIDAVRYFVSNVGDLRLTATLRGWAKLIMPAYVVKLIKKNH